MGVAVADPKDGFIERWSRRKRTVRRPRAEEGPADQTAQAPAGAAPEVEPPTGPPSEAAGDPEVVARAIVALAEDAAGRLRMGEGARRYAEERFWTWEARLQAELEEVERLVGESSQRQAEGPAQTRQADG